MSTIILYGDQKDSRLSTVLLQKFSKFFTIHFFNGEEYRTAGTGKEITLLEIESIKNINSENSLIVFKNDANTEIIENISQNNLCIVDSENKKHLQFIQEKNIPAVTCGMLQKDTFTFSSLEDESAVVSMQRSLQTLSKKRLDPFDMPVRLTAITDEYTILSYCAIMVLLEIDSKTEIGYTPINFL